MSSISYTKTTLLENTSIYNYGHLDIYVVQANIKSTRNGYTCVDITKKLNDSITKCLWKNTDKMIFSLNTLTIDTSKFNEYVGYDIDIGCSKILELTLSYSKNECLVNYLNSVQNKNCLTSRIIKNTNVYGFSHKNLSITNAVIKTVKLPCVEVNITESLKKEIFIDNCDKFLIIDSCKLSEYVNNEIDSNCTNYLDLDLNYNCSTSTCTTVCPTPCTTVCPTPCTTVCPTPCQVPCPTNGYPTYSSYCPPSTCNVPCNVPCPTPCNVTDPTYILLKHPSNYKHFRNYIYMQK